MLRNLNSFRFKLLYGCCVIWLALLCHAPAFGQNQIPEVRISLNADGLTLEEVLDIVSQQSGVPFLYNPKKIPLQQQITYRGDQPLSAILDSLMALTSLQYRLVEEQIVLKP